MPLYEYQCLDKGHTFEVRHPITQDPVKECPVCGGSVRRIIYPVGIVFKGSGFYATDSRGKGVSSSTRGSDSSDSKPAESKSGSETKSTGDASSNSATNLTKSDSGKPSQSSSSESKAQTK